MQWAASALDEPPLLADQTHHANLLDRACLADVVQQQLSWELSEFPICQYRQWQVARFPPFTVLCSIIILTQIHQAMAVRHSAGYSSNSAVVEKL